MRQVVRTALLLGIVVAAAQAAMAAGRVCNVRKYGAKGDGTTKDTASIQKAIDTCARAGGGTVKLEGGTFVAGPIVLKSNITLDVEKDAVLLGSPDHADYPRKQEFRAPGYQALIGSVNAEHVAIVGGGVLDGNGASWWAESRKSKDGGLLGSENTRPRGIVFDHSKHIRMQDVTVKDMPYWQVVPYYSNDVVLSHLKIMADPHSPNTDAIDPFSSSHVVIDHVFADVGDDDVAIKSGMINSPGPDAPSRDITITDCEFHHGHGLSIGSEIAGGVQNVRAERIHFVGTDQGIRVKSNRDRGHDVSHLSFKDITMEDVKTSILISEYYPKVLPEGEVATAPVTRLTPFFHDITIENVQSKNSQWAGAVVGLPESPVKGVLLKNVQIQAQRGMTIAYAEVRAEELLVRSSDGRDPVTVMPTAKVSFETGTGGTRHQ